MLLPPEAVRLVALLASATILLLASFAFSRAGVALLALESVRLLALLPSPTILLLATRSLLRVTVARLAPTSREFLASVTCAQLIFIGLLQPSAFLHDYYSGACPVTSASWQHGLDQMSAAARAFGLPLSGFDESRWWW